MEKISVIAIIYKVEHYLRKCLDSLINQTYPNLEIILVDDGSPDGCPAICDEYARTHKNIKVIHKANGGAPVARNTGLDCMTGQYFTFVDTDDYLAPVMYETLYSAIKKYDADLSLCAARNVFRNSVSEPELPDHEEILDNEAFVSRAIVFDPIVNSVPWNKLYKTEVYGDLRFNDQAWDDLNYFVTLLPRVQKAVITNEIKYNYVQRAGSVSKYRFDRKKLSVLDEKDRIRNLLESDYPQFIEKFKKEKLQSILQLIYMSNISDQTEEVRLIRKDLVQQLKKEKKRCKEALSADEKFKCNMAANFGFAFRLASLVHRKRSRKKHAFFID